MLDKKRKQTQRKKRLRARIQGTALKPRFCVFRSSHHIYAQLVDDEGGKILVSSSDLELSKKKGASAISKKDKKDASMTNKVSIAYEIGKLIAERSLAKKIEGVVFDRSGYKYHGRVKALAEGARDGGLKF